MASASYLRTPESHFQNLPLFPYKPHYVNLPSSKQFRLAYIDECTLNYGSQSKIFLCLHGVPVYSYLYRKVIPILLSSDEYHHCGVRVICPDFIGWGRSDKPTNAEVHTFKYHRNSLIELIKYLKLDNKDKNITMICQDWGGLIGLTLPMGFISYSIDNILNKVIETNNNPIKRVIYFNTTIPDGTMNSSFFMKWRALSRNSNNLPVDQIMKHSLPNLTQTEINGYSAPFVNKHYKLAIQCWPSNVPVHPDYEGLDIWNKAYMFWKRNKLLKHNDNNKIKLFQCHGCLDRMFNVKIVKSIYNMMIGKKTEDDLCTEYGISSETGGILWVVNGGHFLQESPDIQWIIHKALKYFGDIPYDDIEYEWMMKSHHKIIKITLNNLPVNVLSFNLITGLNNILTKFTNSKYCDGFILTSNTSKKTKVPIFSAGYDLKLFATKNREKIKKYFYELYKMEYLLHSLRKPIIAGINGSVIAGGTLLILRCDYRIIENNYYIAMNESRNGIKLRNKSTYNFIKKIVGSDDKTIHILQTGKNFNAEEAEKMGLINEYIKTKPNRKTLLDRCVHVLCNDYLIAEPEAAGIVKYIGNKPYINKMEDYSEDMADLYANTFLDPKVQQAINKLFSRNKKSKL